MDGSGASGEQCRDQNNVANVKRPALVWTGRVGGMNINRHEKLIYASHIETRDENPRMKLIGHAQRLF